MSNELVIAVIAAGAAVLGGGVTGLFAMLTGRRQAEAVLGAAQKQAEAAFAAAQRQAEVQLEVLRESHSAQESAAVRKARLGVYTNFLKSFDVRYAKILSSSLNGRASKVMAGESQAALEEAFLSVTLEGTEKTVSIAKEMCEASWRKIDRGMEDVDPGRDRDELRLRLLSARARFIWACREEFGHGDDDDAVEIAIF